MAFLSSNITKQLVWIEAVPPPVSQVCSPVRCSDGSPPAAGANIRNVNKTKPMLAFENAFFSADQWMRVYLDGQVAVQRTNTQRTNTAIHGPRGEGRDLNYKAAAAAKINKL